MSLFVCSRLSDKLSCTLCVMQGMYALFVSADEMYLCIDSYSSWITRSVSQHGFTNCAEHCHAVRLYAPSPTGAESALSSLTRLSQQGLYLRQRNVCTDSYSRA